MGSVAGLPFAVLCLAIFLLPRRDNRFCLELARAHGFPSSLTALAGAGLAGLAAGAVFLALSFGLKVYAPMTFVLWQGFGLVALFWLVVSRLDRAPGRMMAFANDNLAATAPAAAFLHAARLRLRDRSRAALLLALLPQWTGTALEAPADLLSACGLVALASLGSALVWALVRQPLEKLFYRPRAVRAGLEKGAPVVARAGAVRIGYGRFAA